MKPSQVLLERAGTRARAILAAYDALDGTETIPPSLRNPAVLADARAVIPIGPDPAPCTCHHDRHRHGGKTYAGRCLVEDCPCTRWYENRVESLAWEAVHGDSRTALADFRWWDKKHADADPVEDGQLRVRPSDTGTCKRRVWYRNFPPPGFVPAPTDERPATAGTIAHDGIGRARAERYPWRDVETWVVIPGLDRRGRIDGYDPLTRTLEDLKTVSDRRFEMLASGPEEDMWDQVDIYALALIRAGKPVERLRVRLLDRDNGHEEVHDRPYDEAKAKAALSRLLDVVAQLETYRDAVEAGVEDLEEYIPPREGMGPDRFPCGWCPARMHCWNVPAALEAHRSPFSWTILGPTPLERSIEVILADYKDAAAAEKEAAEAKSIAKDLLDGITPGAYGAWTLKVSTFPKTDAYAFNRHLLSVVDLPDGYRPTAATLQASPPQRFEKRVTISATRAAKTAPKKRAAAKGAADHQPVPQPVDGTEGAA